ncbi:MAG: HDOD domain-containing protein [Planctomycetota bacterium]|nr:HDOD domain-containing protein [Planctomycetota bacterium]
MTTPNQIPSSNVRRPNSAKVLRNDLNSLIEMLQAPDSSLIKFGEEVSRHPAIVKQILRAANSSLTGSVVDIREPTHATLFLGSRRVVFLLNTLPPEIIEENI